MRGFSRLTVLALAWGALTAGAREPWAYWPLAAGCAGLGLWAVLYARSWSRPDWRTLAIGAAIPAVAIALQAVPLPYGLFTAVSPAADEFLRTHHVGFFLAPPAWHALSIAPGATVQTLVLYLAFACALLGLVDGVGRIRLDKFVVRLMGLGVALAVFGVVQRAAAGTEPLVYGLWKAPPLSTPFGPFFNRNHFAGWMIMALPLALGYAVAVLQQSDHPSRPAIGSWLRWLATPEASRFLVAAFAVLAMATALVVTGSRSGIAAFAVSAVVFGALAMRQAGGAAGRRVALVGVAALFVAAVAWAGAQSTFARFSLTSVDLPGRVAAWQDTLRIAADFIVAGTGLGTYRDAMLVYQTGDRIAIFAHAHNEYLQLLAEGGVLVAVPALAILAALVVLGRRRLRDQSWAAPERSRASAAGLEIATWIRIGAASGLVAIAAQSVVEYSLQRAGNAALAIVLLAILLHRPRSSRPSGERRPAEPLAAGDYGR